MASHTIELDAGEYEILERSANVAGLSVPVFLKQLIGKLRYPPEPVRTRSRWAALSERVRREPPLRGAGDYVLECSHVFREDFALLGPRPL